MVEIEEQTSHAKDASENIVTDADNNERGDNDNINVESKLLNSNESAPKKFSRQKSEKSDQDRTMTEDINKLLRDMPLTDDVTCGFWIFKGKFLQRFANQTSYVILYGLAGCMFSMTYAYFNGTITTIEKRFKIPSKNTGIISVGNDISQMMVSAVLSYYAGRGHKPRWIGFGLLTIMAFCMLTAAPHFLYGPGDAALALTAEFGAIPDENATMEVLEEQRTKTLCRLKGNRVECLESEGNFAPQLVLFAAQFISGIGGSLYYTLGVAYMDDNIKKSKTPVLLSLSYFLRMLGPAIGYALASMCLRVYIAPQLHPIINDKDPRWLGAWWMGWLIVGTMLLISGVIIIMFPRELPRTVARRMVEEERKKQRLSVKDKNKSEKEILNEQLEEKPEVEHKASFSDMLITFKRLTTNKILMYNNLSSIFYLFGYTPYWIFSAKYIEIIYRQSASTSSMVTGTVALAFSAIGVLLSGFVITKYKPRARYMAAWNVIVGFVTVAGIIAYAFIGCPGNEQSVVVNIHDKALDSTPTCNSACGCDYVPYSPVCGENNMTYISPCHAGCQKQHVTSTGKKYFFDCSCVPSLNTSANGNSTFKHLTTMDLTDINYNFTTSTSPSLIESLSTYPDNLFGNGGQAVSGACPVDCFVQFVTFLAVMCCLKFFGATGRASNFLVAVRCVPEKDKTAAMGFGMMMMSMFAFIPSPIFFGWVLDRLCLVWGKTCSNKGNCWLYDPLSLRYTLNMIAAVFIAIGAIFDGGVWYYAKDLKIFDEEVNDVEMEIVKHEEDEKKVEI